MSALVGLMEDEMTTKLRDIFDTLFGIKKSPEEKGDEPIKIDRTSIAFPEDQKAEVKVTDSIELKAKVINAGGMPVENAKVYFTIDDVSKAEFVGTADNAKASVDTDITGIASLRIKGLKSGVVTITTTTKIGDLDFINKLPN